MARDGMIELIDIVRGFIQSEVDDYQVGTALYWTNTQIQKVLDRNRTQLVRHPLARVREYESGTAIYTRYMSSHGFLESGTAAFVVQDGTGNLVGTANYTADYINGELIFDENTGGSALYLTARSYNVYMAASDIWTQKAAHFTESVDWKTDNMEIKRSQTYQHAYNMAQYYLGKSPARTVTLFRSDIDADALKGSGW